MPRAMLRKMPNMNAPVPKLVRMKIRPPMRRMTIRMASRIRAILLPRPIATAKMASTSAMSSMSEPATMTMGPAVVLHSTGRSRSLRNFSTEASSLAAMAVPARIVATAPTRVNAKVIQMRITTMVT